VSAKPVEYNATVVYKQLLTPTLGIFRIKKDTPWTTFVPGQYAILGLNHPEKGGVMRAYSIASAPYKHPEYLEFYIRFVNEPTSDNPLTHLLFKVEEGDRIMARDKIQGKFTVKDTVGDDDPRLKVFVASGTGLAPFTSMVFEHAHANGGKNGPFAIFHGASYPTDLGYVDELEGLMNAGEAKLYLPTVSRPGEAGNWKGLVGRVESHFEPAKLETAEQLLGLGHGGFNPKNVVVLICGLQGTIANTITSLLKRGFVPGDRKLRRVFGIPEEVPGSVFYEQYDTTPIIDPNNLALVESCIESLRQAGVPLAAPSGA
jgi:ferredoxin--NADP+ reductase